jgi:hypothetical protein
MNFPKNYCRPGSKTHRLYEHLKEHGAITLREIHLMGNDTARLRCEIKPYLRRHDFDVECIEEQKGNPLYKVVWKPKEGRA